MADPGLQAERTELSWRRTFLALVVVAVLAWRAGDPLQASVAVVAALVIFGRQRERYQARLAMLEAERAQPAPWVILGVGAVVCLLAIIGVVRQVSGT